jgi:hypothetical protein
MWRQDKIIKQKEYFREQRTIKTGKFTEFTVRTFYCIYKACAESETTYCLASKSNAYNIKNIIYEGFYDGVPDHDNYSVIEDCKKHLKEMGYIRYKKRNDEKWYIYVLKPLDFLLEGEHEFYMEKYRIDKDVLLN